MALYASRPHRISILPTSLPLRTNQLLELCLLRRINHCKFAVLLEVFFFHDKWYKYLPQWPTTKGLVVSPSLFSDRHLSHSRTYTTFPCGFSSLCPQTTPLPHLFLQETNINSQPPVKTTVSNHPLEHLLIFYLTIDIDL